MQVVPVVVRLVRIPSVACNRRGSARFVFGLLQNRSVSLCAADAAQWSLACWSRVLLRQRSAVLADLGIDVLDLHRDAIWVNDADAAAEVLVGHLACIARVR